MAGVIRRTNTGGIYNPPTPEADQAGANQIREGALAGQTAKAYRDALGTPPPDSYNFGQYGPGPQALYNLQPGTTGSSPNTPFDPSYGMPAGTRARQFLDDLGVSFGGSATPFNIPNFPPPGAIPQVNYDSSGVAGAEAAAFARAKDRAAQTAQGALRGLQGALQSRGMGGAGYEAAQIGKEAVNTADQTGDVNRELAIQDSQRAQHAADLNYQGGVTQRGQDIGAQNAARQAELEKASLGLQSQALSMRGLSDALSAFRGAY